MKRIILCFDGTWNRLDAPNPTNVVLTAQSIAPECRDGVQQVVFYDEGVGTTKSEAVRGGAFGKGLVKNLEDGYRFLVFNYDPDDEIYVFGFSRGAYTARSFVGLLNNYGVLIRHEANHINDTIAAYRQLNRETVSPGYAAELKAERSPLVVVSEDDRLWRITNGYPEAVKLPLLKVAYLGVWDTVGSLGIPDGVMFSMRVNKRHRFHDTSLSGIVERARHAVAIDERRTTFSPTLWDNLDKLNEQSPLKSSDEADLRACPYQQVWFPGTHGAVGGGGDRRGLSDNALQWIWEGARQAGLEFSGHQRSLLYSMQPDHRDWLNNSSAKLTPVWKLLAKFSKDRLPGPSRIDEVSASTIRRWHMSAGETPEGELYRPKTLQKVAQSLDHTKPKIADTRKFSSDAIQCHHVVERGDNLSSLAVRYLGSNNTADWQRIFEYNTDILDDPDRIYVGQVLRIPTPLQSEENANAKRVG